jgi:hypothetical protein
MDWRMRSSMQAEVVVEARIDRRPNAELGLGHEVEHSLGEDVGRRMTHAGKALFLRQGSEIDVGFKWFGHMNHPPAAMGYRPALESARHVYCALIRLLPSPALSACEGLQKEQAD